MKVRYAHTARRELAFVVSVALVGLVLVTVVAFTPWYGAMTVALRH
jgi:hypothetical protein